MEPYFNLSPAQKASNAQQANLHLPGGVREGPRGGEGSLRG